MVSLVQRFLFGIIFLVSIQLKNVHSNSNLEVSFQYDSYSMNMDTPKLLKVIIKNSNTSSFDFELNRDIRVVSSNSEIVKVSEVVTFEEDIDNNSWNKETFTVFPIKPGNAKLYIEIFKGKSIETASQTMIINVYRNQFSLYFPLFFKFMNAFLMIVPFTLGVVINFGNVRTILKNSFRLSIASLLNTLLPLVSFECQKFNSIEKEYVF